MNGKPDSTSKHSDFEPPWRKNFGGMTWSKLWGGWHQIIGGDISPPSPPGFAPLHVSIRSQVFDVCGYLLTCTAKLINNYCPLSPVLAVNAKLRERYPSIMVLYALWSGDGGCDKFLRLRLPYDI